MSVFDVLSAPRNALMDLLGMPRSGSELLSQTFGMDPNSGLTHGLGILAEILTDPLTALAPAIGSSIARLARVPRLAAEADIGAAAADRLAAQRALVGHALDTETAAANAAGRMQGLRGIMDPESLATGAQRQYARVEPGVAEALENMGLGVNTDAGFQMRGGLHRNASHADKLGAPGVPPPFLETHPGRAPYTLTRREGIPAPTANPTPYERYLLQRESVLAGPDAVASIHGPDVFDRAAQQLAGEVSVPMPMVHGMEAGKLFGAAQSKLTDALMRQERYKQAEEALYMAALAGGLGGTSYTAGQRMFGG